MKIDISVDTSSGHANFALRKTINAVHPTGTLTDANVLVRVFKGGGVDTGNNMYLYGNCEDDFDDIIFSPNTSGSSPHKHKRFGVISGVSAFFLVQMTTINTSITPMYLHYKYSSASDTSVNTHLAFQDDFESYTVTNTPSGALWKESTSTGDFITVTAGDGQVASLVNTDGSGGQQSIFSRTGTDTGYAIGYVKFKLQKYTDDTLESNLVIVSSMSENSGSSLHCWTNLQKDAVGTIGVLEYHNHSANPEALADIPGSHVVATGGSATYYEHIIVFNGEEGSDTSHFYWIDVTAGEIHEYLNLVSLVDTGGASAYTDGMYFQAGLSLVGSGESELYLDEVFWDDYGSTLSVKPLLSVPDSALVLTNLKDIQVSSILRGGGQLSFKYLDDSLANFSTIKGWLNSQISVTNDAGSKTYFWGELRDYKLQHNGVIFKAKEMLSKLQYLHCAYNPVLKQGNIKFIDWSESGGITTLYDYAEAWTGHNTKIIIASDLDGNKVISHPSSSKFEQVTSNDPDGNTYVPMWSGQIGDRILQPDS